MPALTPLRVGALAALAPLLLSGCSASTLAAASSLGITPATVLSTVIRNLPDDEPATRSSRTSRTSTSSRGTVRHRIPASPAPSAAASRLLHSADAYLGVPYKWGGNTPREGFDCSGFTKYLFAKYGVTLPRTSREQAHAGRSVPADFADLRPGDLMFFAEPGEAVSHVAIYAGDGRIVHSASSEGGVAYTDLNTGGDWFVAYFVAARRVQ